ncbi:hypothetical protein LCGC14_0446620 [marine sediment metagenome]|uniref:Toprim domain-containing protein n=1 Tax=marine sediment metagenome TaxID=412755 RepID=A0A0F9V5T0_9ZZZZ
MTPEDLRQQLAVMGVSCRIARDEVVVEICRECANPRWNLELNPIRGLYHCWSCGVGGRLDTLLRDWLNDPTLYIPVMSGGARKPHVVPKPTEFASEAIVDVPSAAHFLAKRGIDTRTSAHYGLVVCTEHDHLLFSRIVLPVRDFWTGELIGHVGRTYTNGYPKYLHTLPSRHVASGYRVRKLTTPCILVEGILDGIAVHRAGFQTAVLLGTAAPWAKDWAARLNPDTPIVILLDGAALEEATRLHWMLQTVRTTPVHLITLPVGHDPATFIPIVLTRLIEQRCVL